MKKKVLKWSEKFIEDVMSDLDIIELSKLPDNEYGEESVGMSVGKDMIGDIVIEYSSYGNIGEIKISGFDKNGKPYFGYNDYITSYDDMVQEIKNEIKNCVEFTLKYNEEKEKKWAKARYELSRLSKEEKDEIVLSYLFNNMK